MNNFNRKRKIIFGIALIILIILLIWYVYFYSPDYNFITEEDMFYNKNDKEEVTDILQNNVFEDNIEDGREELGAKEEVNLITIHIARCCKKRRCY